jgi:hypothetical protein
LDPNNFKTKPLIFKGYITIVITSYGIITLVRSLVIRLLVVLNGRKTITYSLKRGPILTFFTMMQQAWRSRLIWWHILL